MRKKKMPGSGVHKYHPTDDDREFVYNCRMAGTSIKRIAKCLNIATRSVKNHFMYEITMAQEDLCGNAAKCISDAIDEGNVDAAKFVLARKAGWTEKTKTSGTVKVKSTNLHIDPSDDPAKAAQIYADMIKGG